MNDETISIQQFSQFFEDSRGQFQCVVPVNRIPPVDKVIAIDFMAYVTIPAGFVMASNDFLSILNIDRTQMNLSSVSNPVIQIGGRYMRVAEAALLEGILNIDVVLDGFTPVCAVRSPGLSRYTSFSYTTIISVSKVLAFSRYESDRLLGYRLVPRQGGPFAVNNRGVVHYKNSRNSKFIKYLEQSNFDRVIHVPYTIFIQPYQAEVDH